MKKIILSLFLIAPQAFAQTLTNEQLIDQYWVNFRNCESGSACPQAMKYKAELEERGWCYKMGVSHDPNVPPPETKWVKCTDKELKERKKQATAEAKNMDRIRNIQQYCYQLSFVYGQADLAKSFQRPPTVALDWSKKADKIPEKTKKGLINYVYFKEKYHVPMAKFEMQCAERMMQKQYQPLK